MKWEVVKKQVADGVRQRIIEFRDDITLQTMLVDMVASGRFIPCREAGKAYGNEAHRIIMDWDIRCAEKLRELFPGHFPESLLKGRLVGYMADNENCDWTLEKEVRNEEHTNTKS